MSADLSHFRDEHWGLLRYLREDCDWHTPFLELPRHLLEAASVLHFHNLVAYRRRNGCLMLDLLPLGNEALLDYELLPGGTGSLEAGQENVFVPASMINSN